MTMSDDTDNKMLETTFAEARARVVVPSDGLLDRIMMDADTVLGGDGGFVAHKRPRVWASMMEAIGGWTSMGGLAAATVAGVWIGVSPPDAMSSFSAGLWGSTIEVPLFESDVLAGLEG